VWVEPGEIERLAEFRGESTQEFAKRHVRRVGDRYSLIEKPGGDCIFWDAKAGCTVYTARPIQCRTWPFWPENIATPGDWDRVERVCPGAGHGQWFSVEEIEAAARRTPE
jgi:Fe-S-cluster containining protein